MRLLLSLILMLAVTACGGRGAQAGEAEQRRLFHDGVKREFLIERPDTGGPAPAIVVLHGGGGNARQVRRHTGFTLSEKGWVEIYPNAIDKQWNDGRTALAGGPLREGDDLGFLREMLRGLIDQGLITRDRIYVTGPSNGGAMTQRMVCQTPEIVAGAAPVIMNFPVGLDCPGRRAVPMLFILGTEDPLVPFHGGPITVGKRDRGGVMPAPDTLAFYSRRNGCAKAERRQLPDVDPDDGTRVSRIDYRGCQTPLAALIAEGGGHTWAGGPERPLLRRLVGTTSRDFSATAEIERFFLDLDRR